MRGTKERSFAGKLTGGGKGKTEPALREWRREAAASRINQKRATRVKPSRPYFFLAKSFLGSKIQRHQYLYDDTAAAVVEFLDANDFAQ